MMKGASKARFSGKEVADSPVRNRGFDSSTRLLGSAARHAEQKRRFELSRRSFLVKALVGALAGGVALGAPSLLRADDVKVARAGVQAEKGVQYETFSDPAELEPYFDNAKDKLVSIKPGEVKRIGEFEVWIDNPEGMDLKYGTVFKLKDGNGKEHKVTFGPLSETNILELDLGNHPYFKGKIVIFADEQGIVGAFKTDKGYDTGAIPARSGKMRDGPIRTGVMLDGDTLVVIGSPEQLREGDVVYQAQIYGDGSGGTYFYKYVTTKPAGTMIASL